MEKITGGDLESGWQPPAPDQGLESNLFFQCASCGLPVNQGWALYDDAECLRYRLSLLHQEG